jgi:hypothetical protein
LRCDGLGAGSHNASVLAAAFRGLIIAYSQAREFALP